MNAKINRRKATWHVRVPGLLSQAVTTSGAWLRKVGGTGLTDFAGRHPELVKKHGDEDAFVHLVQLHLVHEGRELLAELEPDRAEALGYELIRKAAAARTLATDGSRPAKAAGAHKAAQASAAERGRELLRSVWPALKQGQGGQLTCDSAVYGYWYLWVSDDGARVRAELRGLPAAAWTAFVKRAVDRLHFQQCWPGGAADLTRAAAGEYLADVPYRSEYPDALELAPDRTAVQLDMRGLELAKVAEGLAAMLKGAA
ncbi:hypothetical protein ACIRPQ_28910 [Streptomyces sp. NPDC101213]|uniref:hypothetical protein n=1 Tax=Streptomyces sp. NPDC101213 TaxID=3366130 RepID=UPI00381F470E